MSLYNMRNPAVKRLMKEAEELLHPTEEYYAQPIEDNLFEWHFTLRGPPNTDYEGGIYHGRITLPPDYPMKPPSIILLTPNGRFETNKKICLSISGHHPESWQPSWSIRTALLAIIGFMPTHGNGALGSLEYTPEERQQLALRSQEWECSECGSIKSFFVKKKTPECQSENSHSLESKSDSVNNLNQSAISTSDKSASNISEKCSSNPLHCLDDKISLVHRQKHFTETSPPVTEYSRPTTRQNENNRFYSVLSIVILTIIIVLCLRRLLSL